jgi:hypothetical protein
MIEIPVFTAIKFMVHDIDGALRGFEKLSMAKSFIEDKPDCWIIKVPTKTITVEECLI